MEDFTSASRRALKFLYKQFGLELWMLTRVENDDWIVLSVEDHNYGVSEGQVLKWSDSFCTRMVDGEGPHFAPDADAIPAYRDAPIRQQVKIGSYVGLPIRQADGSLFGTLCAVSPEKQTPELEKQMDCVRMVADLLTCLLDLELKAVNSARRLERAVDSARTDFLTSLYNRRGWDEFVSVEEDRCRRYGHPACVISIDLDDLKETNDSGGHARGDELLKACAGALKTAVRAHDIVARMGGDEFAILGVECDLSAAAALLGQIRAAFSERSIHASFGMAMRRPATGLSGALDDADRLMYEEKRGKKGDLGKRSGTYG